VALILLGLSEQEEAVMEAGEKVETTLGELIVALTEETSRFIDNETEAYQLVAYILSDLLYKPGSISAGWHEERGESF